MKPDIQKRAAKRILLKSIDFTSSGYRYKINETLVVSLALIAPEQYELVSPSSQVLKVESFGQGKKLADQFVEDLKSFCERRLIATVSEEIIQDRFQVFFKDHLKSA